MYEIDDTANKKNIIDDDDSDSAIRINMKP